MVALFGLVQTKEKCQLGLSPGYIILIIQINV